MKNLLPSSRLGWLTLLGTIVFFVVLFGWLFWPISRDQVARAAVRALENGDAHTLLRLTTHGEREKLDLSDRSVDAFLRLTLWRKGYPSRLVMERIDQYPVDDVDYKVFPIRRKPGELDYPLYIKVTLTPNDGWCLALGETLRNSVFVSEGWGNHSSEDFERVKAKYKTFARQCGIKGSRTNMNGYHFIDSQAGD